ncbi:MAG: hypothetical protein IKA69_01925 [Kiritimatiellae bacterium]|nr:hypothetical protein [Kiritimatiellia bacterium]
MATTPENATAEQYGVETVTEGITVESENISDSPIVETVPDQKNAVRKEHKYDKRTDLKLTYRGTKLAETAGENGENDTVTYNGVKYYVDTHEKAGIYNGLQRYNLTAHKFDNAPAQPTPAANNASGGDGASGGN